MNSPPTIHNRHKHYRALIAIGIIAFCLPVIAYANPSLNNVAAGQATVTQTQTTTTVNQTSQKAIINWNSFNIGNGEHTHFQQPNGGVTLNRINPTNGVSEIYGQLTATGQIILVNPAGIHFGPNAYVNVGGLIASTANISNEDFLNGYYQFVNDPNFNGAIHNQGHIIAADHGLVALIGGAVNNQGLIQANMGYVVLASGNEFTMSLAGNNLVSFTVDDEVTGRALDYLGNEIEDGIQNTGDILAHGGQVLVTAKAASGVLDHVINLEGRTEVMSAYTQNGELILAGDTDNGVVRVAGDIDASGKNANETGGTVAITGYNILIDESAAVDVSGSMGGGKINAGGNYLGQGPLPNANAVVMRDGASLNASAIDNGDGGSVIVWSDNYSNVNGEILAQGGLNGGDGGFVETSSKNVLNVSNLAVDTTAPVGGVGEWLLDPYNVTISSSADSGGTFDSGDPNTFTPTATANISNTTLNINLGTSDVTITTSGAGADAGDITINAAISWTADTILTLIAHNDINNNSSITATGAGSGLEMIADSDASGAGTVTSGGTINVAGPVDIYYNPIGGFGSPTAFSNSGAGALTAYMYIQSLGNFTDGTNTNTLGALANNNSLLGGNFALARDIDASATSTWDGGLGWRAIGRDGFNAYTGKFDGRMHTISNLYVNRTSSFDFGQWVGMFYRNSGTIENLYLSANMTSINFAGILASENSTNGLIQNVHTSGSIVGTSSATNSAFGGIAGRNDQGAIITQSSNSATVTSAGGDVGGITGSNVNGAYVRESYNTGSVSGGTNVGGIVGEQFNSGNVYYSYNTGTVTGSSNVGAVAGFENNGFIFRSFFDTDTTGFTSSQGCGNRVCSDGVGGSSSNVRGVSTATMKDASTYTTLLNWNQFDADTITSTPSSTNKTPDFKWIIFDGQTRPMLLAEWSNNIENAHQLQLAAAATGANYTLTQDIDLQSAMSNPRDVWGTESGVSGEGFAPITNFSGNFDGVNYTISNLYIDKPSQNYVGLFGSTTATATIENVGLVDVDVTGQTLVGGLVGYNLGYVTNSFVRGGTVTGNNTEALSPTSSSFLQYIGGIIGYNEYVGGSTMTNLFNSSTVSGGKAIGGLIGGNWRGNISNSYNTGDIISNPSGSGFVFAGGLIGTFGTNGIPVTLTNSYNAGSVSANTSGSQDIGGLVGFTATSSSLTNTYNVGTVSAASGSFNIGGLVGRSTGSIASSYSSGLVSASGASVVGGFIGTRSGIVSNSFWDVDTSGQTLGYGNSIASGLKAGCFTGACTTSTSSVNSTYRVGGNTFIDFSDPFTFLNNGWGIASSSFTNATPPGNNWIIFDNFTRPILGMEWSTTISNAHQLQLMGAALDADYTLANDIDFNPHMTNAADIWGTNAGTSGSGFRQIGETSDDFTGSFNGNNFTISNLYMNAANGDVGIFYDLRGTVSNLTLQDIDYTINSSFRYGGGVATRLSNGTIDNVNVTGSLTSTIDFTQLGGLVNNLFGGTINNSSSTTTLTFTAGVNNKSGGIAADVTGGSITNSNATTTTNTTGGQSGGLAGSIGNLASISGSNASLALTATGSNIFAGGLVAVVNNSASITNSHSTGLLSINGSGSNIKLGGLVAELNNTSTISDSFSTVNITNIGNTGSDFGGLVADSNTTSTTSITRSYAKGNVTSTVNGGSSGNRVGGLVGDLVNGNITNSFSSGNVTADGTATNDFVGGFAGRAGSGTSISTSYSTGNVSSAGNLTATGGFIGQVSGGTITDNYTWSTVTAGDTTSVGAGGFVGDLASGTINRAYSIGNVSASGGANIGGFAGKSSGTITNSFWDTETSGQATSAGGTGKTTAEMKSNVSPSTYSDAGWDFASVWNIAEDESYPFLRVFYNQAPGFLTGTTSAANGNTIQVALNGTLLTSTTSDSGAFSIGTGVNLISNEGLNLVAGQSLLIYIDDGSTKSNFITIAPSGDLTDISLANNTVTIGVTDDVARNANNTTLTSALGSINDPTDILFDLSSNNMTLDSGVSLVIASPVTFTVDGNITTSGGADINVAGSLNINATSVFNTGAGDISLASVNGANALTLTSSGTTTFSDELGGSTALSNLTVDGGGTIDINGAGITTTGNQTYTDAVNLGATTALNSTSSGTIAFNSTINGAQAFTVNSPNGTITFSGEVGGSTALASLTTDPTVININADITTTGDQDYGTDNLQLTNNVALTSTSGNINSSGYIDGNDGSGPYDFTVNVAGATSEFSGELREMNSFTKNGAGTLILSGTNSNTTGITINSGTLQIGNGGTAGGLGTGNVINNGSLVFNRSDSLSVGNIISGTGSLTQTGSGTTTLTSSNTYTDNTIINAGILQLGTHNAISNDSAVSVANGATLDMNNFSDTVGSIAGDGNITLGSSVLTTGIDNSNTTFSGDISGTGHLTKIGTGTLTLSGTNTYTGNTTIGSGTLEVSGGSAIADASDVSLTGTLTLLSSEAVDGLVGAGSVNLGSSTLTFGSNSASSTFSGAFSGTGGITKAGSGTFTLTGLNTYTGNTTITSGSLSVSSSNNLGESGNSISMQGGNLFITSPFDTSRNISLTNSNSIFVSSGSVELSGVISGSGTLRKGLGGTLVLSGSNTYTGQTYVDSGTMRVTNNAALGPGSATIISGGNLELDNVDVSSDTLLFSSIAGGSVISIGTSSWSGGVTNADNPVVISGSGDLTISGVIDDMTSTQGFTHNSSGITILDGSNTYNGTTTINSGELRAGTNTAFGTGTIVLNGGRLGSDDSTVTLANNINITANSEIRTGFSANLNLDGVIDDIGSAYDLTLVNTGFLSLFGDNSSFDGDFIVPAGTILVAQNNNALGSNVGGVIANSGQLRIYGGIDIGNEAITLNGGTLNGESVGTAISSGPITVIGSGILSTGNSNTLDVQGAITESGGAASFTIAGNGTVIVSGNNTYTGTTTISNGTLQVGNGGSTGNLGTGNIINNSALSFNKNNITTVSNVISGTGTLSQDGSSHLVLDGANTYSGGTTLNSGLLSLGSSSTGSITNGPIGTGTLTLNGGTLTTTGGTISIANDFIVDGNVTISPPGCCTVFNLDGNGNLNSGSLAFVQGNNNNNLNGNLTGSAPINIGAGRTVTFAGADNSGYSGTITTSGQTGIATATNALGTGNIVLNNGAQLISAVNGLVLNNDYSVAAGAAVTLTRSSFDLNMAGAGTFNTGSLTSVSGTISGSISGNGTFRTPNSEMIITSGNNTGFSGVVRIGSTTFHVGTLTISNASNPLGSGVIEAHRGTLQSTVPVTLANDISTAGAGGSFVIGGSNDITLNGDINFTSGTVAVGVSNTGATTFGGDMTGSDAISKSGAGTLVVTGADNSGFSGDYTISGGTVQIGNGGTTGSLGTGNVTNNGNLAFNRSDTLTYADVISGTGAVTQSGSGTLIFTGANTYSGITTISSGTLQIGNGGATGSLGSGNIVNNSNLAFNRSGTLAVSSDISGTGGITFNGPGTVSLSGTNTYTGDNTINAGTVSVNSFANSGANSALGAGSNINLGSAATLEYTGSGDTTNRTITATGDGATIASSGSGTLTLTGGVSGADNNLVFTGTGDAEISGNITNTDATVTISGSGTWTFSGTNTFGVGASTIIDGATLSIASDAALGCVPDGGGCAPIPDPDNIQLLNGGTLQTTATFEIDSGRGITLGTGGGTIEVNSGTLTYNGVIAGANPLTFDGPGTFETSTNITAPSEVTFNPNLTFNFGGTEISSSNGNLDLSSGVTLSGASNLLIDANGSGADLTVGDITWTGTNTVALESADQIDINGAISGVNGELTLTAANTSQSIETDYANGSIDVNDFHLISGQWYQVNATLPEFNVRNSFTLSNDVSITSTSARFLRALGGNGSTGSPYQLTDIYGVQGINSGGVNDMVFNSFILANDIDATGTRFWNNGAGFHPIGYFFTTGAGFAFNGNFDGNNKVIDGLYIRRTATEPGVGGSMGAALFAVTWHPSIFDLGLTNVDITGLNTRAAGLVAFASWQANPGWGGGTGGLFSNNYVTGRVTSNTSIAGGLFGYAGSGNTINTSYSAADVTSYTSSGIAGGLIGYLSTGSAVNNTYNIGSVTSYNQGTAGGLIGVTESSTTVTNSYNSGVVSNPGDVGGGFIGTNSGATLTNNFWDTDTASQSQGVASGSSTGVTGQTTAQLMQEATFSGWGITNNVETDDSAPVTNWFVFEGSTRPLLMMEYSTEIRNPHQLQLMGTTLDADYTLISDINFSNAFNNTSDVWATNRNTSTGFGFDPVGDGTNGFTGTLDGNNGSMNYEINQLYINRPDENFVGLFGASSGSVSNVELANTNIMAKYNVGSLIGSNSGSATNIYLNNGSVTASSNTNTSDNPIGDATYAGGLIGLSQGAGTTNNLFVDNVSVYGVRRVGGLMGQSLNSVSDSYANNVNITAPAGADPVGGLIGYFDTGSINRVYSTGSITVNGSAANIGGLIGQHQGGSVADAYSTVNIEVGDSSTQIGGYAGIMHSNSPTANRVYASGTITVNGSATDVGGFVGQISTGSVSNSFWDSATTGQGATGAGDNQVGGSFAATAQTSSALTDYTTYNSASWSIADGTNTGSFTGNTVPANTWVIFEDATRPMLAMEWNTNIRNAHQLQLMNAALDADYQLNNDVNLSTPLSDTSGVWTTNSGTTTGAGFLPIGYTNNFSGSLDGNNYVIENLYMDYDAATELGYGLFGSISGANISNVGLVNPNISVDFFGGEHNVGTAVGYTIGANTIDNVFVEGGSVSATDVRRIGGFGGLVQPGTTVANSYTSADVNYTTNNSIVTPQVGGFIGGLSGDVDTSYSAGDITVDAGPAGTSPYVGGFVGQYTNARIDNTYTTSSINYTANAISNLTSSRVGGFIGNMDHGSGYTLTNSYASGSITAAGFVGGFIGVYNAGSATITNNYWDTDTDGGTYNPAGSGTPSGITGADTATLMTLATFDPNWDITATPSSGSNTPDNIWFIFDGNTRPLLMMENRSDIRNPHQLQMMAAALGADYTLESNVDFSNVKETDVWGTDISAVPFGTPGSYPSTTGFVPIGDNTDYFRGTLDGQNFTINNLFVSQPDGSTTDAFTNFPLYVTSYQGLFGRTDVISRISNFDITNSSVIGNLNVGGIVGYADGRIDNVTYSGTVYGLGNTGGIAGYSTNDITNSSNTAYVAGKNYMGGISGYSTGLIKDSYNTGQIFVNIYMDYIGGITGRNNGVVINTFNTGAIAGGGALYNFRFGGIAGDNYGDIHYSYNNGSVGGQFQNSHIGGIAGQNRAGANITDSYNTGFLFEQNQLNSSTMAGIAGENNGHIANVFSIGSMNGLNLQANGIVGTNSGTVVNAFWDTAATNASSTEGVTTNTGTFNSVGGGHGTFDGTAGATLNAQTTYCASGDCGGDVNSFDFANIWAINEGYSYPYLQAFYSTAPRSIVAESPAATTGHGSIRTATLAVNGVAHDSVSSTGANGMVYMLEGYNNISGIDNTITDNTGLLLYTSGVLSNVAVVAPAATGGNPTGSIFIDDSFMAANTLTVGYSDVSTIGSSDLSNAVGALGGDSNVLFTVSGNDVTLKASRSMITTTNTTYSLDGNVSATNGTLTFNGPIDVTAANPSLTTTTSGDIVIGGAVTGNGNALTIDNAGSSSLVNGVMSDLTAFTKAGAGTLALTENNTFTGDTTISNGTLKLGDNTANGSVAGNIVNNGALVFDRTSDLTFSNVISGTGSLTKDNTNNLSLNASNTFTGATQVNSGTLSTGSVNALGSGGTQSSSITVADGATLVARSLANTNTISLSGSGVGGNGALRTQSGTVLLSNPITLAGDTTINTANDLYLDGDISDGGSGYGFTKIGSFTLRLSGSNAYSGATDITDGSVVIRNVNAFGSGANQSSSITIADGATLSFNNFTGTIANSNDIFLGGTISSTANGIVLNNDVTLTDDANLAGTHTYTLTGDITDGANDYNITKSGISYVTLSGNNDYSGDTTISAGTIRIGSGGTEGTLGSGNVINNSTLRFNRSDSYTVDNTISGTGSVLQDGSGTLVLTANNTYSGATTISSGTLQLGDGGSTGSVSSAGITNNGALVFNRTDNLTFSTPISGTGDITKQNSNTLTLTGNNSYDGSTTISGGVLQVGSGGTSGSLGVGNVVNNTSLIFNRSNAMSVSNVISGSGAVNQDGAGTTTLAGANTYSGATTVNNGTLELGADNAVPAILTINASGTFDTNGFTDTVNQLSGSGNIVLDGGSLTTNQIGISSTFSGVISGSGDFGKSGTFSFTLDGSNTYTGDTNVLSGFIGATNNNSFGDGTGTIMLSNGAGMTLNVAGLNIPNDIHSAGTASIFPSFDGTLSGDISGSAITKLNTTILALAGNNSFTNGTISQGTLVAGSDTAFGSSAGLLTANNGTTVIIADGVNLDKPLSLNNASLTSPGASSNQGDITLVNSNSMNIAGTLTLGGDISGTGLSKSGAGTLILTGTNSYSSTNISAGILQVGNGGTTGTLGAGNITNNGSLDFNRSNALSVSNIISGTGAVAQNGAGTVTLSAANTYSGGTTITNGVLSATNSSSLGTGAASVLSGGTLNVNNTTITNALTLNGTGAAGEPGALTGNTFAFVDGAVTLGSNATIGTNDVQLLSLRDSTVDASGFTLTLNYGNNSAGSFSSVISNGSLINAGTGNVTLSGNNTFSGGTSVNNGTLILSHDNALGSGAAVVADGATLQIGNTFDISNPITINGNGFTGRNGALENSLGGTSTVSGLITLGSSSTIGNYTGTTLNITNTGTITGSGFDLTFNSPGNTNIASIIGTGTGALSKDGAGTLTLTGDNTYTGTTTINGGTVQVGNAGATGSLGTGNVTNNGVLSFDLTSVNLVNNAISGTGSLIHDGSGSTSLLGTNTYSGGTTINDGTIFLGSSSTGNITNGPVGTGTITLDGGRLAALSNYSIANPFVVNSESTIDANGGANTTTLTGAGTLNSRVNVDNGNVAFNGNLTGAGDIALGTFRDATFAGADNSGYSGNISIEASSELNIGTATNALGTGDITLNGGAIISRVANAVVNNDYTVAAGATASITKFTDDLEMAGAGTFNTGSVTAISGIISGSISGDGTLTTPNSELVLTSGNNTGFSGDIFIGQTAGHLVGTLTISNANNPLGSGEIIAYRGTLRSTLSTTLNNNFTTTGVGGSLTIGGSNDLTLGGDIDLSSGTVSVLVTNTGTTSFAGDMTGSDAITKSGAGTLILTGADNSGFSGDYTISGGTIQIGNGGTTGSLGTGDVVNNSSLIFNRSDNITLNNSITGSGAIEKDGTGTLTIGGSNNYDGSLTITNGTVVATSSSALGSTVGSTTIGASGTLQLTDVAIGGEALTINGGSLSSTGTSGYAGNIMLGADSTVNVQLDSLTFNGNVDDGAGTFKLVKTGPGELRLPGAHTHDGGIDLNAGVLAVGAAASFGNGTFTFNGGALAVTTADLNITRNIVLNADLGLAGTNDFTLSGDISGLTRSINKVGSSTVTLSGNNTFGGGLNITDGMVIADHNNALGGGMTTVGNNTTLMVADGRTVAGDITLNGNGMSGMNGALVSDGTARADGNIILNSDAMIGTTSGSDTLTLGGNVNGAMGLTVNGPGTVYVDAEIGNTTAPTSLVSNSNLMVDADITTNGHQTYHNPVTLMSDSEFSVSGNGTQNITFNDAVSGGMNLNLTGTGSGTYHFAFNDDITQNNVMVDGGGSSSNNALTVGTANDQTFMLTAANGGNITGNAGVTGNFDFNNINNLNGGSGADNFTLDGGSISGSVNGAGGTNSLTADDVANNWNITSNNGGSLTGVGSFANMQNITGGSDVDIFEFNPAFSITGNIDGGDGTNINNFRFENFGQNIDIALAPPVGLVIDAGTITNASNATIAQFTRVQQANGNGTSTITLPEVENIKVTYYDETFLNGEIADPFFFFGFMIGNPPVVPSDVNGNEINNDIASINNQPDINEENNDGNSAAQINAAVNGTNTPPTNVLNTTKITPINDGNSVQTGAACYTTGN